MIAKVILVILLIAPNDHYRDMVITFQTMKECEAAKAEMKASFKNVPQEMRYIATCVVPKPVRSVDS